MPVVLGMFLIGPDPFSFALPTSPLFVFNRFFCKGRGANRLLSNQLPSECFDPSLRNNNSGIGATNRIKGSTSKKKRENFAGLLCHWVAKEQHVWQKTIRKESATHFLIPPLSGLQRSKGGTPKCLLAFLYPAAMKIHQSSRPQARMNSFSSSYVLNEKWISI